MIQLLKFQFFRPNQMLLDSEKLQHKNENFVQKET